MPVIIAFVALVSIVTLMVCIIFVRRRHMRSFHSAALSHQQPVHLQTFPAAGEAIVLSIKLNIDKMKVFK